MPEYRRARIEGGTYFFTLVTYDRQKLFHMSEARAILHSAFANVQRRYPFDLHAICLLPDHLHCIWILPDGDVNYSLRWGEIKKEFSKAYIKQIGHAKVRTESRHRRGEAEIWQRRFWEHLIRDEDDLRRHLDYIHFNPVKHGLAESVKDWQWSSFHRFVKLGFYEPDWGSNAGNQIDLPGFGE